jgi:hypothetical protein
MAEKHLKIIQNGRSSFVPHSRQTVDFWTKYNSKVAGSNAAHKETVTIMQATAEEEAELAKLHQGNKSQQAAPAANSEVQELKAQLALQQQQMSQQQELMTMLLKQLNGEKSESEPKERAKPGPKPKNENNGESQQTKDA